MVTKLTSKKIIKKIEENAEDIKKYNVNKIGLFGSFSKNEQREDSDIDIIVSFNETSFDNYMDLQFLLKKLFNKKIDLIIERGLKPRLKYVVKEAKYARL
ncbi:nucleotidyltransferase domain-containing protein [Candidatus Pacearchaeota archaeon]|nr:nucleotidyltransferase domain-containing protein [Candidatus Pacearchaeota archaeon]HLC73152.1 nucleotidyltransferase domain-containing protein [Candidatus Nanoarchaeia archaeon]